MANVLSLQAISSTRIGEVIETDPVYTFLFYQLKNGGDFFIVEDKMMPNVARYLARFLGPLGKMPKPFPSGYGIISNPNDLQTAIERYLKIIRIQLKKQLLIQVKIGKKSMAKEQVFENMKAIVEYIADQMPHKYNNIKSMFLKTTMGHPIKIDEQYLKSIEV